MTFLDNFDAELSARYNSALTSGDLIFTASEIHHSTETEYGVECEICYAPLLAKKPQGVLPVVEAVPTVPVLQKVAKVDPFLPHDPALYVMDASDQHKVLLNKFCIVPRHFLIVTKELHQQTEPLSPEDMMAVWSTLKAVKNSRDALAFFNCGTRSGASQHHKHLQVIPRNHPTPIATLVRECSKRQRGKKEILPGDVFSVPFDCINHVVLLQDPESCNKSQEDILVDAYITLMDAMLMSLREHAEHQDFSAEDQSLITSKVAYNWLLTTEFMMIAPRRKESSNLYPDQNGVCININSLGFAGMVLAKSEEEMNIVKARGGVIPLVSETGFGCKHSDRSLEEDQRKKQEQQALEKQLGGAFSTI
ncbi:bifunctional AP-4-A phosphorylase/ADP sulfurylase [Mortierella claussenii]|nr:bifunctional AP-4-A phosphorylase/ADP sulfurylase [Mortierella claussenii]